MRGRSWRKPKDWRRTWRMYTTTAAGRTVRSGWRCSGPVRSSGNTRIQDASYRRAIELDPSHPDAFFQLGYVTEEVQDDPESAMDWYVRQASLNPAHDDAVHRLAACAVELRVVPEGVRTTAAGRRGPGFGRQSPGRGDGGTTRSLSIPYPGPARASVPGHEALRHGPDGNRPR